MNKNNQITKNGNAPFQKIVDASRTTGLSMYFLRSGCKDGTVPHVKSGTTYFVNVPALLRMLNAESGGKNNGETDC